MPNEAWEPKLHSVVRSPINPCFMPGLPTHSVQELNGGSVFVKMILPPLSTTILPTPTFCHSREGVVSQASIVYNWWEAVKKGTSYIGPFEAVMYVPTLTVFHQINPQKVGSIRNATRSYNLCSYSYLNHKGVTRRKCARVTSQIFSLGQRLTEGSQLCYKNHGLSEAVMLLRVTLLHLTTMQVYHIHHSILRAKLSL